VLALAGALAALEEQEGARIGIDLEWRPRSLYADEAPNGDYGAGPNAPALLQIATPTQVLILGLNRLG